MLRVLVVDDSPLARKFISTTIKKLNAEVVAEARDGFEGVEQFRKQIPDLVLLDVTMPNMDGREALKEILSINPNARIIMISAVKDKETIEKCLKEGAQGFLEKSNTLVGNEFQEQLRRILDETPNLLLSQTA